MKPTNQASRRSLVVPVLPAASSVKPAARTPAPVPSLITLRIMLRTRKVESAAATARGAARGFGFTSAPPLSIRSMCRSGRTTPMFGNIV